MNLFRDLRYAVRSLSNSPVFTVVAVLSLALGIGVNSAVFTLLDQALLRALPVHEPAQLVQLSKNNFAGSNTGLHAFSYPMYQDFAKQNQVFTGMFCRHSLPFSIGFQGHNERATGEIVSGTYFPVLGVTPALGRLFTPADDATPDAAPYVVLAYDYWQTRFAGDRSVIGKEILINDHKLTILGVAAKDFKGVEPLFSMQIFIPVSMAAQVAGFDKPLEDRRWSWLQVFGRCPPNVALPQVQASLQPLFQSILEGEIQDASFARTSAYDREKYLNGTLSVLPGQTGHSEAKRFLEAPLWAMMAMVGLVLLIACANVANLLVARGAFRQKEIAVRLALGASRFQLACQLLTESLLLALAGAVVGLLLSSWTMHLLVEILPKQIDPPLVFAVNPDLRVIAFAFSISLIAALLFGLVPAWQLANSGLASTLKQQAHAATTRGQALGRKVLVCGQVSLSLLLLVTAGLYVGTLGNLKSLSPGFEVNELMSFAVDPTLNGYRADRAKLFYRQLSQNLAALPVVQSAALCVVAPLNFDEWDGAVTIEGYSPKQGEDMNPRFNDVSPNYFQTLEIALYSGRDFNSADTVGSPKVAIVNEKFAKSYFGHQSAIGRRFGLGSQVGTPTDIEIIGVVSNSKYQTMRDEASRQIFLPYLQNQNASQMTAFVRTALPPDQMFPLLRDTVRKLDPNLPIFQMKTEQQVVDDVLSVERLVASLSIAFGVLATLLAAIGLYGVLAFLVARRTREIGVRMALGASVNDVLNIVLREVVLLVGLGVGIGLPLALALAYLTRSLLFGLSPFDPYNIAISVAGIAIVALLAGFLPARRAARVDPMAALRHD